MALISLQMFDSDCLDCGITDVLPTMKYATQIIRAIGIGELLSRPEKMPEWAFNIPASTCKVGMHLVSKEGSNCYKCYCYGRGRYNNDKVQEALQRRYRFAKFNPNFIPIMSSLISIRCDGKVRPEARKWYKENGKTARDYWTVKRFRWFDSGDIQSKEMLDDICQICRNTPDVLHWLPTKEHKIVKKYIYSGKKIPDNLDLRLSAHFKSKTSVHRVTKLAIRLGLNIGTVLPPDDFAKVIHSASSFKCPSHKQGNMCLGCTACFTKGVFNAIYEEH